MPWRTLGGDEAFLARIVAFCNAEFGPEASVTIGVDAIDEGEGDSLARLAGRLGGQPGVALDPSMDVPVTPFENELWSILNWSTMGNFRYPVAVTPDLTLPSVKVRPFT